jgi:hypothetical protein
VALDADGRVWVWGDGHPGAEPWLRNAGGRPVRIPGLVDVETVAAGYDCGFAVGRMVAEGAEP